MNTGVVLWQHFWVNYFASQCFECWDWTQTMGKALIVEQFCYVQAQRQFSSHSVKQQVQHGDESLGTARHQAADNLWQPVVIRAGKKNEKGVGGGEWELKGTRVTHMKWKHSTRTHQQKLEETTPFSLRLRLLTGLIKCVKSQIVNQHLTSRRSLLWIQSAEKPSVSLLCSA